MEKIGKYLFDVTIGRKNVLVLLEDPALEEEMFYRIWNYVHEFVPEGEQEPFIQRFLNSPYGDSPPYAEKTWEYALRAVSLTMPGISDCASEFLIRSNTLTTGFGVWRHGKEDPFVRERRDMELRRLLALRIAQAVERGASSLQAIKVESSWLEALFQQIDRNAYDLVAETVRLTFPLTPAFILEEALGQRNERFEIQKLYLKEPWIGRARIATELLDSQNFRIDGLLARHPNLSEENRWRIISRYAGRGREEFAGMWFKEDMPLRNFAIHCAENGEAGVELWGAFSSQMFPGREAKETEQWLEAMCAGLKNRRADDSLFWIGDAAKAKMAEWPEEWLARLVETGVDSIALHVLRHFDYMHGPLLEALIAHPHWQVREKLLPESWELSGWPVQKVRRLKELVVPRLTDDKAKKVRSRALKFSRELEKYEVRLEHGEKGREDETGEGRYRRRAEREKVHCGVVAMENSEKAFKVETPFFPTLSWKFQDLDGKQRPHSGAWYFPTDREPEVRRILMETFGTDGNQDGELIRVRLYLEHLKELRRDYGQLYVLGRKVAHRSVTATEVTLGKDVSIVRGGFPKRGGRGHSPRLNPKKGTVLEIRNVPLQLYEHVVKEEENKKAYVRVRVESATRQHE